MSGNREPTGANGLTSQEFEDVMRVQQELMAVINGTRPFSYPHAERGLTSKGHKYKPSRAEEDYMLKMRSKLLGTMMLYTTLGFTIPYLTLRTPTVAKYTRFFKRPFAWGVLGGSVGFLSAMGNSRLTMTEGLMKQEGSPIARELRYRFWLANPDHPYLRGFEDEFDEYERWQNSRHYRDYPDRSYSSYRSRGSRSRNGRYNRDDGYDDDDYYDEDDYDDRYDNGGGYQDRRRKRYAQRRGDSNRDYDYDDYDSQRWSQGNGGPSPRSEGRSPRKSRPPPSSSSSFDESYGGARSRRRQRRERDEDESGSGGSGGPMRKRRSSERSGGSYSYGSSSSSSSRKKRSGSSDDSSSFSMDEGVSGLDALDLEKQKKRERFYKGRGVEFGQSGSTLEIKSDDVDTHLSDMFSGSKKKND